MDFQHFDSTQMLILVLSEEQMNYFENQSMIRVDVPSLGDMSLIKL